MKMINKTIFLILALALILLVGYYFLQSEEKEEAIDEITDEIVIEEEEETKEEEEIVEEEQEQATEWETFTNPDFSYTAQYPSNWDTDLSDYERVWFYSEDEGIAILFASETATETGFSEYELISQEETLVDGNFANTSLLYSENTRAILTGFESENHPHFVMMTYESADDSQDSDMMEFNEEFLSRITFQ